MSTSTSTTETDIRIERVLQATIDRVYDAWTKPELLTRWYCPNPELELKVDADVRVGGSYVVTIDRTSSAVATPNWSRLS
jgi:uncharacterized protein YndB with AHSA1/START domain